MVAASQTCSTKPQVKHDKRTLLQQRQEKEADAGNMQLNKNFHQTR